MKSSHKEDNIIEFLRLESEEEKSTFQKKRIIYWDDFEQIIKNFFHGIKNEHDAEYINTFAEEMKLHSKTVKEINKALKDEEIGSRW